MSVPYARIKTVSIMVHKDAVPSRILRKLVDVRPIETVEGSKVR